MEFKFVETFVTSYFHQIIISSKSLAIGVKLRIRSVLFVRPDYHNSYTLRSAFRDLGWRSNILVPHGSVTVWGQPTDEIVQARPSASDGTLGTTLNLVAALVQYLWLCLRYRVHVHYGRLSYPPTYEESWVRHGWVNGTFHLGLAMAKLLRTRIVYIPSGCRDEELRQVFEELDGGTVCGNCGVSVTCDDEENRRYIDRANRYANLSLSLGFFTSTTLQHQPVRYKVMPLGRNVASNSQVRIVHSHAMATRVANNKNIKATPEIEKAMARITERLPSVEFHSVSGLDHAQLQSLQQRSHIVIDQLRYGHWGSTALEALSNGCVVVCYMRPEWKEHFDQVFSRFPKCPVVSATPETLEQVILGLVSDRQYIRELQRLGQEFAGQFFCPQEVAFELAEKFAAL